MSTVPDIPNPGASGIPYYTPKQDPLSGSAKEGQSDLPLLFKPIKIRGLEFQNRIFLSPMCQYSAEDGHMTFWHYAHAGSIITRGVGLAILESTSVTPEGRITPEDSGLWKDSQIEPLKNIVTYAHSQGQKIGIQLGHAGRKASTLAPWLYGGPTTTANEHVNGWPNEVIGSWTEPFDDSYPTPKAATKEQIKALVEAFAASAKRAVTAGFDVIEIHNAHGYLLHNFVSPAVNKRTDEYGGSFENRTRLTLEVVDAVRKVIPETMPLFWRISATDWLEEVLPNEPSWSIEETIKLSKLVVEHGVDFIDVSTGGGHVKQKIVKGDDPAYQSKYAHAVKEALGDKVVIGSVGGISSGKVAQTVLERGDADVVLIGRYFLKNPGAVFEFAEQLGVQYNMPHQIDWAFAGRHKANPSK